MVAHFYFSADRMLLNSKIRPPRRASRITCLRGPAPLPSSFSWQRCGPRRRISGRRRRGNGRARWCAIASALSLQDHAIHRFHRHGQRFQPGSFRKAPSPDRPAWTAKVRRRLDVRHGFSRRAVEAGGMGGFDLQERRAGEDRADHSMQDRVFAMSALPAPAFHDAGRYCRENGVAHVLHS